MGFVVCALGWEGERVEGGREGDERRRRRRKERTGMGELKEEAEGERECVCVGDWKGRME